MMLIHRKIAYEHFPIARGIRRV